jgi:hypothetical protein
LRERGRQNAKENTALDIFEIFHSSIELITNPSTIQKIKSNGLKLLRTTPNRADLQQYTPKPNCIEAKQNIPEKKKGRGNRNHWKP